MIRAALLLVLLGGLAPVRAQPPPGRIAALERGINVTNWFRFPPDRAAKAIGAYLSDAAIVGIRRAGFTFVRLPFDPRFAVDADGRALLIARVRRLQQAGLAVVIVPSSSSWRLETTAADRDALLRTWRLLAPSLRLLPPARTFPEIVNEPVFPGDAAGWAALQSRALAIIRAALPEATVVLTGGDWSSVRGLLALNPVADANVVYTFHFYTPAELTSLASYRSALDRGALARLPFPENDAEACAAAAPSEDGPTRALIGFVCRQGWDRERVGQSIAEAARWAARNRVTLLAGEFGATARLNPASRLAWIRTVREACERARIGWALWGYDDVMGFDQPRPPPPAPRLDSGLLDALGLPPGGEFIHDLLHAAPVSAAIDPR